MGGGGGPGGLKSKTFYVYPMEPFVSGVPPSNTKSSNFFIVTFLSRNEQGISFMELTFSHVNLTNLNFENAIFSV